MEDKWISVKDGLPEIGRHILIYIYDNGIYMGAYLNADLYFKEGWYAAFTEGTMRIIEQSDVTHWQPLPKPPKQ